MWVVKYIILIIILQISNLFTKNNVFVSPQQTDIIQTAGDGARLVGDILKLFAEKQQSDKINSEKIVSTTKNDGIFPSFNQLFMGLPQKKNDEKQQLIMENNNVLTNQQSGDPETWKIFANQMMNMFGLTSTTPQPPKSTNFLTDTIGKYFNNINDKNDKEKNVLFPMTISPETQETLFGSWANLFNGSNNNKEKQKIDTGDGNFDRIVIREKADSGNFFENLVGTKYNERGLQWTNGNLRLVNKNVKDVLGSEVSVHDRSIDIPVQKWFSIAENFLGNVKNQ
ncbi:Hypothetical protein SRAE_X000216100 [Strongyloides ratti]|uniref:Uncharacterized protein n=1 Tax=Strongyloides ratti TaxID=34506 RepID=A0A090MQH4_STRRB|nr:Hypothetical protein SRAE_X000216100 [Strongyloides ratti]CEF60423.1 Hypothetical protein SRAE_X000216100 [Strongyloides ratti]